MKTQTESLLVRRNSLPDVVIASSMVHSAIDKTNVLFSKYADVNKDLDLFGLLGMRNLSAFVGEAFVATLAASSSGQLRKNPHQDGYPDLLMLDDYGKAKWDAIENKQDKSPFSPFEGGGIEVKATCGGLPNPAYFAKRGMKKPELGDTRIQTMTGYDWKAHHRLTNNLIGLLWDFYRGVPEIVAAFFSSDLSPDDWGEIVQPREGGGRTTSVSIMTRGGVRKMALGCLYCKDGPTLEFVERVNGIRLCDKTSIADSLF